MSGGSHETSATQLPAARTKPVVLPETLPCATRSVLPAAACDSSSATRARDRRRVVRVSVVCCPTMGNMFVSNANTNVRERVPQREAVRSRCPLAGLSGSAGFAKSGMPYGFGGMFGDAGEGHRHRRLDEDERREEVLELAVGPVVLEAEAAHARAAAG